MAPAACCTGGLRASIPASVSRHLGHKGHAWFLAFVRLSGRTKPIVSSSDGSAPALNRRAPQLDAIVVPASRPATSLDSAVTLARDAACDLVVLCSQDAKAAEVTSCSRRGNSGVARP